MDNEKLIAYLENEIAARDAKLVDYNAAKDKVNDLRQALLEAESALGNFEGIDAIIAEKAELEGFVVGLKPVEAPVVDATPIEEMAAEQNDPQPIIC